MDNTYVNIFYGVEDMDTSKKMTVLDVIWGISEGKWENQINMYRFEPDKKRKEDIKRNLPAVTFAGTLSGARRTDANVDDYTQILVCDIDKIPKGKLNAYKNILKADGYVMAYFESPSRGLKVLIRVNSELKHHVSHAFVQIEQYMMEHYEIVIDPTGKNPSRLCFISFDPNMYYNVEADIFPVDTTIDYEALEVESTMRSIKHLNEDFEASNDANYVFEAVCDWIANSKVGSYGKGNRNNFIFCLSCRLSESGMNEEIAFGLILGRYPSLGIKEIKTTVRSGYKKTNTAYGTKPVRQRKSDQENLF